MTFEQQLEHAKTNWNSSLNYWTKYELECEKLTQQLVAMELKRDRMKAQSLVDAQKWVNITNRIAARNAAYHGEDTEGFEV